MIAKIKVLSGRQTTVSLLNVPPQTVSDEICRFKKLENDGRRPESGRKRAVNTSRNRKAIEKWVHRNPSNCDENKTVVNTSLKSVQTSHDVNLRITQAFSHIGKGYSAIEKFCMVMNIDPFSSTTYGKCARWLDNAYTLASENIFAEIHREIKNVYENGAEITDLSVSFDGTWLTRGHTSLFGVG
ncbi:uncharacterized protein TNCV_4726511 [Trichonephila clavipes]|nr:uncharacterized protein TNCV_4726511 [Trichonephila clavipes]